MSNWDTMDAAALKEQLSSGKLTAEQIIDVREPAEWEYYHIDGSRHVPMNTIPGRLDELDAEQPLYIVCAHGVRSEKVCRYLAEQGYDKLTNIAGGMAAVSALEGFQYD
ncbi:rhodanese-like domain-containing protein [Paenibacillus daejeonensis]|uniref:rhodanese-like domain-containing protein n=1 Tax=Paenibacillus daejeonensis TaxID=135193 RepID=UPI00037B82A7|nr:rhodanese-like domain-containing protein [Paenibacillus daejeonensis]